MWGQRIFRCAAFNLFVATGMSSFAFLKFLALTENAVSFFGVWVWL
jgi:hypothetical protein